MQIKELIMFKNLSVSSLHTFLSKLICRLIQPFGSKIILVCLIQLE